MINPCQSLKNWFFRNFAYCWGLSLSKKFLSTRSPQEISVYTYIIPSMYILSPIKNIWSPYDAEKLKKMKKNRIFSQIFEVILPQYWKRISENFFILKKISRPTFSFFIKYFTCSRAADLIVWSSLKKQNTK